MTDSRLTWQKEKSSKKLKTSRYHLNNQFHQRNYIKLLKRLLQFYVLLQLCLIVYYKYFPVPYTTTMFQRQLASWLAPSAPSKSQITKGSLAKLHYQWVAYGQISNWAKLAVVSLEDGRFASHHGIDWSAMNQAIYEGRGGSTITQQVVKNALLWQGEGWDRYLRKALEIPLSYVVDWFWGKRRILEIYLNIIEVGPLTFGIEMAAQKYFQRSAAKLTSYQAALVAAVLPNPLYYQINKPSAIVRNRQNIAIKRMFRLNNSKYLNQFESR